MAEYLSAAEYLPHRTPMMLLDELLLIDEERAHCRVRVGRDTVLGPFLNAEGQLPAWFGIEILAQTIGVWSGWHGHRLYNTVPRPGMLLGGRGYQCKTAGFPAGALLDVQVQLLMRDEKIGSFEGVIFIGGERYAGGRLNIYQPDDHELQQLLQQGDS
ncbi:3-hydroxy-fatty acyl-ACP dehydratase [Sodalis sp. dw_96]|uniref:ApeP family dehydratase n=1 Tax=Sodalis sp. dw_96 TaxID=2719794 RepID=UPI001BD4BEE1|nr:3-hydroxy-fatty acyl-ACP dehydratase [Sodalis sp. dw_96]